MAKFNEAQVRKDYDAIVVPELMRTGELDADLTVNRTADEFMESIVDSLMLSRRALSFVLNFDHSMLVPFDGSLRFTDEKIHRLQLYGAQTLASVMRSRDDLNYLGVEFAKYPLTDRAMHVIRRISEADSEEPDLH